MRTFKFQALPHNASSLGYVDSEVSVGNFQEAVEYMRLAFRIEV